MLTDTLHRTLIENGGFTFKLDTGEEPRIGDRRFAVAYSKSTERVYNLDTFTIADLVEYIATHEHELSRANVHLGGWVDDGKVFLDCSIVVGDINIAIEIANRAEQIAIFCFEDCTTKIVNPQIKKVAA